MHWPHTDFHLSVPMTPEYCGRYVDLAYSYTEFLQQFHFITAGQCDNHTGGAYPVHLEQDNK